MPKPSDYFLSDEENADIFERLIRPAEFGRQEAASAISASEGNSSSPPASSSTRPVCIILAGQTGAGKSHTAPALAEALERLAAKTEKEEGGGRGGGGAGAGARLRPCHLVADTHKPYHPAYAGLVADAAAGRGPPGLASAATGHDARRWLARACAVAAGGGGGGGDGDGQRPTRPLPTLVESASRYPQDVVEMAGIFRRAGYHVCLVLMAAHAAQSRLGLLARYLDAQAAETKTAEEPASESEAKPTIAAAENEAPPPKPKLPVRLTPRAIHDESYDGLAQLADRIDGGTVADEPEPLADAVLILRRGNRVAYANYWGLAGKKAWQTTPPNVSQALAAERARRGPAVAAEAELFASDVVRLRSQCPERTAELEALAAEYNAAMRDDGGDAKGDIASLPELYPLDADALLNHLRTDWGQST